MSFLNPAVLFGLAAAGLPIAIHLLNKSRVRTVRWAAMSFLVESVKQNQRRLRMEDLILLILRCLTLALLVLAFAWPVWKVLVSGEGAATGQVADIVLLDNSASMGQSDGVQTRFEQGKKAIRDLLDSADPASSFGFYLVSNRAVAMIAQPGQDFALFRRSLETASLSDRATDLSQGIRTAFDALQPLTGQRCEIDVYTDSQAPAWSRLDDIRKLVENHPGIRLKPVILGSGNADNIAVTGFRLEGGMAAVNQPCRFLVDITNYGTQPAADVRATLSVDGDAPSNETTIPAIAPGATQSASLLLRLPKAGFHTLTASIPPGRLPISSTRTTAVRVLDHIQILIVEGSSAAQEADRRDGFFLGAALAPILPGEEQDYFLKKTVVPQSALGSSTLAGNDIIFLCNPGDLSTAQAQALKDYVTQGGKLVIFPGANTNPSNWHQNALLEDLLPATLGAAKQSSDSGGFTNWKPDGFDHPVTAIWNDPAQGNLGSVQFSRYFPMQVKPADAQKNGPSIMIRMADGSPAVMEWSRGRGRVVLFNAPVTTEWGNLPLHPVFVPLIQRLVGYLTGQSATKMNLAPGEAFEAPVSMDLLGQDFSVIRPGKDSAKHPAGRVELDGQQAVIRYRDTESVGGYRIFVGNGDVPQAAFAVQLDPSEADLRQADRQEIEDLAAKSSASGSSGDEKIAPQWKVKWDFWGPLVCMAAITGLAEMILAHVFSRR